MRLYNRGYRSLDRIAILMAEHTCHFCSRRAFSDEDNPALSIEPQAAKVQPVARTLAPIRAEVSRHRGAHPKREFSGNTQTIERRNAQRDIHHHNDDPLPRSPPDWQKSHDSSQESGFVGGKSAPTHMHKVDPNERKCETAASSSRFFLPRR